MTGEGDRKERGGSGRRVRPSSCRRTSVMDRPAVRTLFALLLLVLGEAQAGPVKGGEKTAALNKTGQWTAPKDWDWSVTSESTPRLIPVSEVMDDLPTPGYRMRDLQQRVQVGGGMSVLPTTEDQASRENKLESAESRESDEAKPSSEKAPEERVPVVEEPMKKVVLPEFCSITGIGCRDSVKPIKETPEPKPTTTEKSIETENTDSIQEQQTEKAVFPHIEEVSPTTIHTDDSPSTTHSNENQNELTPESSDLSSTTRTQNEELDSHQHTEKVSSSSGTPFYPTPVPNYGASVTNKTESSETTSSHASKDKVPEELNIQIEEDDDIGITLPPVLQQEIKDAFVKEVVKVVNTAPMFQEEENDDYQKDDGQQHLVSDDVQKEIRDYFNARSFESGESEDQVVQRRLDANVTEETASNENDSFHTSNGTQINTTESLTNTTAESVREGEITKSLNETSTPQPNDTTESPSLGERLSSYWKSATEYINKTFNL